MTFGFRLKIFLPFAGGYFLSYLYRTINSVLGPNLATDVGVDPAALGLLTATYFITFAAFQLPLGILLDRFGPRRVEAALLVAAAAGAFVFSHATTLYGLVIGRALIGLGVSACLMAAFKAYVTWFPKEQLPRINGYQLAAGGLGALSATAPVEAALAFTDWRGVFDALAIATLLASVVIFWVVPKEKPVGLSEARTGGQLRGLGQVASSLHFWQVAPWTMISQATFLSVQGLWAGPWLRDVAGLDRADAAGILLLIAAAMMIGFITSGMAAERLARSGIAPMKTAAGGMLIFMLVQMLILLHWPQGVAVQWMLFGFFGTTGVLPYAALSQHFPTHLAGRVNTALNLLVFVSAFAAQWGIGALIDLWPAGAGGGYAPAGYRAAFGVVLLLQAAALIWYAVAGRWLRAGDHSRLE